MKLKALAAAAAAAAAVLAFSACDSRGGGQDVAVAIRKNFLEAEKIELVADLTADYGDRVYGFTFRYTGGAKEGELEISAPAEVAGLKARVSFPECELIYDGAQLDTGALAGDGLSPAEAVPVLISQWQSGYVSSCYYEKHNGTKVLAVETDVSDSVSEKTWFDIETLLPVRSELYDGDRMVIACDFEDVVVE